MIKNIIFDMGNVLLRFDKDYFLDAVGVQGADRKLLMNNVYLSLEWARMDRGSMTEAEAAESMCRRLPSGFTKQRICWLTGGIVPSSPLPAWSSW